MHPMFKVYVQVVGMLMASTLVAQEQTYTAPQLFSGTLYLSTISELSNTQAGILNAEVERTNNVGWLVGIGSSEHMEGSAIWRVLTARTWAAEPMRVDANAWSDEAIARLSEMKRGSCVCIDDRALADVKAPDRDQRAAVLRSCLDRGVLIVIEAAHTSTGSKIADQWNLTPDIDLVRIEKEPDTATKLAADRISLQVAQGSLLRIGRRDVANLSDKQNPASYYLLAATSHYQEPVREAIASLTVSDLTAARRALSERQQPMFPATKAYQPKLDSGSLVIVGGGGMSTEIWEKFIELAGGKESRIIVLPTAVPEPEYEDDDEVRTLKRLARARFACCHKLRARMSPSPSTWKTFAGLPAFGSVVGGNGVSSMPIGARQPGTRSSKCSRAVALSVAAQPAQLFKAICWCAAIRWAIKS